MILAIASGKGGTGKTTVAVNMARSIGNAIELLDCDVEEPNDHLFLKGTLRSSHVVTIPVPSVDGALCDDCGECGRFCEYHAIVCMGGPPLIFPEICHGCGGCAIVCPRKAIKEISHEIGVVEALDCGTVRLLQGRLKVGSMLTPMLIRSVKERAATTGTVLIDAPPGTSCPVVAAVEGAHAVALVTEPTPFGLNDLMLAVDMMRALGLPFGVVINRAGMGDNRVNDYCRAEKIPLLAEIPNDRRIAEAYSKGKLAVDILPEMRAIFLSLYQKLLALAKERP